MTEIKNFEVSFKRIRLSLDLILLHHKRHLGGLIITEDGWAQGVIQNVCSEKKDENLMLVRTDQGEL